MKPKLFRIHYLEPILKTSHPVATFNLKTHREEHQPPAIFEGSTWRGEEHRYFQFEDPSPVSRRAQPPAIFEGLDSKKRRASSVYHSVSISFFLWYISFFLFGYWVVINGLGLRGGKISRNLFAHISPPTLIESKLISLLVELNNHQPN